MAKGKKPRLPFHQMLCFSVGHVMNDFVNTICASYLLTFQTKVLGLPSNIVGFLWLIPAGIDAFLALLIGHVSDNFTVPYMSRYYGRRKTWHLLGCCLVGVCSPFFLMPCFICGDALQDWAVLVYYVPILVLVYAGWGLTQSNFLALIPVLAKRQSEMVKLGAINSAITLMCGIFIYIVTWALLGSDSSETLSSSQWRKFMYLVVIAVGTGAFFSAVFHVGTREPAATGSNDLTYTNHSDSIYINKCANDESHDVTDHHVTNSKELPSFDHQVNDVIKGYHGTAIVNQSYVEDESTTDDTKHSKAKEMVNLDVKELESVFWKALSEKEAQQNDDASSVSSGYGDISNDEPTSEESSDSEVVELPMPGTFMDMVPNVSEFILHSHRSSARSSPFPSPRLSRAASKRFEDLGHCNGSLYNVVLRSRLNSSCTPIATPRLCRQLSPIDRLKRSDVDISTAHVKPLANENTRNGNQFDEILHHNEMNRIKSSEHCKFEETVINEKVINDRSPASKATFEEELKYNEINAHRSTENVDCKKAGNEGKELRKNEIVIHDRSEVDTKKKTTWRTLFRKPEFYKLACAYMFTRVSQNITTSYLPLFLTDHLHFGKESIAYFPLVILLSGVFASLAAKKFNKMLGNKWTFCLGSILVMGASGWLYLLTPENRSAMYVPAILTGSGSSIMFVTSLALAADFVDSDRSSGAFTIASMSLLCKIVIGVLFCLLQEFAPQPNAGSDCPECTSYVRHVFCLIPGISAFFGLISFILFIPATIQCKPIAHTTDAETQTEVFQEGPSSRCPLQIIVEDECQRFSDATTQTEDATQ